jgi:HD-GYP domain-containing protein (c-di-GMP phosphodiesterase class II)
MMSERFGMPPRGSPGLRGDETPLPVRIIHVALDAALQHLVDGPDHAARVIRDRAGKAFDPRIAATFADDARPAKRDKAARPVIGSPASAG